MIRIWYPSDKRLSLMALLGNAFWIVIVALFGQTMGNLMDPRILIHGLAAAGLLFFSLRSIFETGRSAS